MGKPRFDLNLPQFSWDNEVQATGVIVLPNPVFLTQYQDQVVPALECVDRNQRPWDQLLDFAFFKGKMAGRTHVDAKHEDRLNLAHLADKNGQHLRVSITDLAGVDKSRMPTAFEVDPLSEPICEQIKYKYMIVVDGDASSWLRGPLLLYSNAVPVVIETRFAPLYQNQWIPWIHYVPVKNDQSDLIEQIKWLKENDEKAQEIARNGRELFSALYGDHQKIKSDAVLTLRKYHSMMNYEPETPAAKYFHYDKLLGSFD